MTIDQNTLTFYAALMEHIYRRDHLNDQALNLPDIAKVIGLQQLDVVNPETNTVYVKSQGDDPDVVVNDQNPEAASLGQLLTHDVYYYSERGFVGMIVEVGGKFVVVFRGVDSTLSGWSSVWATAPDACAEPGRRHIAAAAAPSYI